MDFESDIYSLGVVMYEMVTGKVPFTGDNPVSVALKHMQEQPASLLAQRADMPLGLERIIFKALEKNPAYRFGSMQEMADALLDLQLYLEERGYYQQETVLTSSERDYGKATYREATPERKEIFEEATEDGGDRTRVIKHGYLEEGTPGTGKKKTKKKNVLLLVAAAVLLFLASFWAVQGF